MTRVVKRRQVRRRVRRPEERTVPAASQERAPASGGYIAAAIIATALSTGIGAWYLGRSSAPTSSPTPASTSLPAPAPTAATPPPAAPGASPGRIALQRGNWHFDRHEWREAIADYRKAIDSGIDNPDIRTDLGSAYRFSGQFPEAIQQYDLAQKQNPDHENSLYDKAALYAFELKDRKMAASLWQEYLKRFPQGRGAPDVRRFLSQDQ